MRVRRRSVTEFAVFLLSEFAVFIWSVIIVHVYSPVEIGTNKCVDFNMVI